MTELVNASVTTNFTVTTGRPLLLEVDRRLDLAPPGAIRVRLYPAVPAQVAASAGNAVLTGETRIREVAQELVELSGSNRFRTKWPISTLSLVTLTQVLFTQDASGFVAADVQPTDFHLDPSTGEIVAPVALWGAVLVDYTANYRIINYYQAVEVAAFQKSVTVESGTVYAFYDGEYTSLEIEAALAGGLDYAILYRAVSLVVVDADGPWEAPPNWPDSSSYPSNFAAGEPDPAGSATRERDHEIGYYNSFGQVFVRRNFVAAVRPYVGHATYYPQVYARFADSAPEDFESGYARAIQSKSKILERLDDSYYNFIGEQS